MAEFDEVRRERRRRGLARIRHIRHAAGRYRPAISRSGAGSAAGVRMVCRRPPAAVARRLGHRAAKDAVTPLLRLREPLAAPAPSQWRADPATTCVYRTASAAG